MKQVDKTHYEFEKYTKIPRWISYWYQVKEVLALNPNTVLVIGPGDGVVVAALKQYIEKVHTLDIAEDLNPDFVGSVLDINATIKEKYDVIVCCQVLEHLPLDQFETALKSIKESSKHLVLSLPYAHTNIFEFFIRLPKMISFYFNLVLPKFYKKWTFDGEHYWEVGSKGACKKAIRNKVSTHLKIKNEYHVQFHKYHIFYICES